MSKHTPGEWIVKPWEVRDQDGSHVVCGDKVVAKQGDKEVEIFACTVDGDGERREADLHLIAAAPDLLAALIGMVAIHDEPAGFVGKYGRALDDAIAAQQAKIDQRLKQARAAIAKAKGEAV